jgi:hypothetical protein
MELLEAPDAEFINMIMSRLHATEEKCDVISKENVELRKILQSALYLKDGMCFFSDGMQLMPGFAVYETTLWPAYHSSHTEYVELPLDSMHANATAFTGKFGFEFEIEESGVIVPKRMIVGKEKTRTSVKDFVEIINEWCTEHLSKDARHQTWTLHQKFAGWKYWKYDPANDMELYKLLP